MSDRQTGQETRARLRSSITQFRRAAMQNHARLAGCRRHQLVGEPDDLRVRCDRCGGEMTVPEATLYARGYQAHGGDPLDVWPSWRRSA